METEPLLKFGLLHYRPNTDIAKLIEKPVDGLIKQLLRLSKGIPDNRGFQSSGGPSTWKRSFRSCLLCTHLTQHHGHEIGRNKSLDAHSCSLVLNTMESIKAVFFKPDPAAQVSYPAESRGNTALTSDRCGSVAASYEPILGSWIVTCSSSSN